MNNAYNYNNNSLVTSYNLVLQLNIFSNRNSFSFRKLKFFSDPNYIDDDKKDNIITTNSNVNTDLKLSLKNFENMVSQQTNILEYKNIYNNFYLYLSNYISSSQFVLIFNPNKQEINSELSFIFYSLNYLKINFNNYILTNNKTINLKFKFFNIHNINLKYNLKYNLFFFNNFSKLNYTDLFFNFVCRSYDNDFNNLELVTHYEEYENTFYKHNSVNFNYILNIVSSDFYNIYFKFLLKSVYNLFDNSLFYNLFYNYSKNFFISNNFLYFFAYNNTFDFFMNSGYLEQNEINSNFINNLFEDKIKYTEQIKISNVYTNHYPIFFNKNLIFNFILSNTFKSFSKRYIKFFNLYIVNFFESTLKSKIVFKINTNIISKKKPESVEKIINDLKTYNPKLSKYFIVQDMIEIVWHSLENKDLTILNNWIRKILRSMDLKNHKKFLQFFFNFMHDYGNYFLELSNSNGFFFKIKGKISVTGNAKKRKMKLKLGTLNTTKFDSKIVLEHGISKTNYGVLGYTIILSY